MTTTLTINDVLSRLQKVRRSSGYYMACCPAHADDSPSLKIKVDDRGNVRVHCFAGCDWRNIWAAIGIGKGVAVKSSPVMQKQSHRSPAELANLMANYRTAINPERLEWHAASLGLAVDSLRCLGIGWAHDKVAWAFPMRDIAGKVRGIRLRDENGKKWAISGSADGMFIPDGLSPTEPLMICEGPTSCAALLDYGFNAIGRPSCLGGTKLIIDMLRGVRRRVVYVFGDNDAREQDGKVLAPGENGAMKLAAAIKPFVRDLKVIIPPFVKDPRAWKQAGATREQIERVVSAANYFTGAT